MEDFLVDVVQLIASTSFGVFFLVFQRKLIADEFQLGNISLEARSAVQKRRDTFFQAYFNK